MAKVNCRPPATMPARTNSGTARKIRSTRMWLCSISATLRVDNATRIVRSPVISIPPGTTIENRLRRTTSATVSPIMTIRAAPPV